MVSIAKLTKLNHISGNNNFYRVLLYYCYDLFMQVHTSQPHPQCSRRAPLILSLSTSQQPSAPVQWQIIIAESCKTVNHVLHCLLANCFPLQPDLQLGIYAVVFCRGVEKLLYLVAANSWCDQYLLLHECICAIMTLTHTNFGRESPSVVVFYEFIYLNLLTNLELKLKYTWSNIL